MSIRAILLVSISLVISIGFYGCVEPKSEESNRVIHENVLEEFKMPPLPEKVLFCGKEIAIDNFDLKERLDKELLVNTYFHSSTIQYFKRANKYFSIIEARLKANGIPSDFKYLCLIESGLTQATSPSGAKGFWQFMPETAKEFNLLINQEVDERLNVEKSTDAACKYLKSAFKKFHDWSLVAASYNMGVAGVENELKRQQVDSYFSLFLNNETSRYVFRILALKLIIENADDYGFHLDDESLYSPSEIRRVEVNEQIPSLIDWAISNNTTYRMVKVLNPWILGDKITNYPTPFYIEIPA